MRSSVERERPDTDVQPLGRAAVPLSYIGPLVPLKGSLVIKDKYLHFIGDSEEVKLNSVLRTFLSVCPVLQLATQCSLFPLNLLQLCLNSVDL